MLLMPIHWLYIPALVLAAGLAAYLFYPWIENFFVFYPYRTLDAMPETMGLQYRDAYFDAENGETLHGWYFPNRNEGPVILFCHGNAGNISHRLDHINRLLAKGLRVFIFDYRGYGKSRGRPSEKGVYLDGMAAYDYLIQREDILPEDIVPYGHSLGAAEATILGMLLSADGWRVARVYASGSPRITDAAGAAACGSLPLVRIVNEGDPVPLLPPRTLISPADPYVHIGDAVVLLDGPYYCVLGEESKSEPLAMDFWRSLKTNSLRSDVKEHFIASYIERIRPKAVEAVEVPAADRARYISGQPSPLRR